MFRWDHACFQANAKCTCRRACLEIPIQPIAAFPAALQHPLGVHLFPRSASSSISE